MQVPYLQYDHNKYIQANKYVNRESIFKIGDWVVRKDKTGYKPDQPLHITDVFLGKGKYPQQFASKPSITSITWSTDYEHWKPKIDDWCWNTESKSLGVIKQIVNDDYYFLSNINRVRSYGAYTLDRFIPYIGEIPEFLKD